MNLNVCYYYYYRNDLFLVFAFFSALTTIEGIIEKAVEGIEQGQILRRVSIA